MVRIVGVKEGAVSRSRDKESPPCGLLVVDKPVGCSSMDVVRRVRRAATGTSGGAPRGSSGAGGERVKTGHAGTLDPLASGVLVCCLGRATRCVEQLMGLPKVYEAEVDLGAFTASDDREGQRQEVEVMAPPDRAAVEAACRSFVGRIEQKPPAFSAIHVAGRRAYQLARKGQTVAVPARYVTITAIDVLGYDWPSLYLRIICGRGTYIRSLARDLGRALATGGHVAALRRTGVGDYTLKLAVPLHRCDEPITQQDLLPEPG